MKKEEKDRLIAGYFDDTLSEAEEKMYEELYERDSDFAEEADIYREIHIQIEYIRNKNILKEAGFEEKEIRSEPIESSKKNSLKIDKNIKKTTLLWLTIAASVSLFVSVFVIWQKQFQNDNKNNAQAIEKLEKEGTKDNQLEQKENLSEQSKIIDTSQNEVVRKEKNSSNESLPNTDSKAISLQYISSPTLDRQVLEFEKQLASTQIRAGEVNEVTAFEVISPKNNSSHSQRVYFEWKSTANQQDWTIRLINHKNVTVHEDVLVANTSNYEWKLGDREPGIYYWQLSHEESGREWFIGKILILR